MYEIIDHTADIGIRVDAGDWETLLLSAAEAMFAVMVESKPNLIPAITIPIDIEIKTQESAIDAKSQLLLKWLQELLYIFETRRIVPTHFYIDQLSENTVEGCLKGLKFDQNRHKLKTQIKAVTYHQLQVEKTESGWVAQVIFDI